MRYLDVVIKHRDPNKFVGHDFKIIEKIEGRFMEFSTHPPWAMDLSTKDHPS